MTTDHYEATVGLDRPVDANEPGRNLRRWWGAVTILIAAALFVEAAFAGAMLSGAPWARAAHAASSLALIVSTAAAGIVGLVTLRRVRRGARLGWTLLALAGAVLLQTALGKASAHGANLLWLHVPLGVALVGLATQVAATARRLGGD